MNTKWILLIGNAFLAILVGCAPSATELATQIPTPMPPSIVPPTLAPTIEPPTQVPPTLMPTTEPPTQVPTPLPATVPPTMITMTVDRTDYAHPEALVDVNWVADHLNDPTVRIIDARAPFKSPYYLDGHIPGAVFVDVISALCCPSKIMSSESFAQLMGKMGIGDKTTVVFYDTDGGLWSARLWWALRYYGHNDTKLLNGGLHAWEAAGKSLDTNLPQVNSAVFNPQVQTQWRVTKDEVRKAVDNHDIVILDALSRASYAGNLYDYGRPGHITTALSFPAQETLNPGDQTIRSPKDLSLMLSTLHLDPQKKVITYCGGGYYGAHAAFVLYLMGFNKVSLYDGSLMEWASDPANPMATEP